MSRSLRALVAGSILLLLAGCGRDHDRLDVRGTVRVGGAPLAEGQIQFLAPLEAPAPMGGAVIVDGRYEMGDAHGLSPGTYLVRISSPVIDPDADTSDPMAGGLPVTRDRIRPEYNVDSELEITVEAGHGPYDFDLEAEPPPE